MKRAKPHKQDEGPKLPPTGNSGPSAAAVNPMWTKQATLG